MALHLDKDGFPLWPNLSPQKPGVIPGRQIQFMIQDTRINLIPGGRADEIPFKQKPVPRQAKPEGTQAGYIQEKGKFGSSLYDSFMGPLDQQVKGSVAKQATAKKGKQA